MRTAKESFKVGLWSKCIRKENSSNVKLSGEKSKRANALERENMKQPLFSDKTKHGFSAQWFETHFANIFSLQSKATESTSIYSLDQDRIYLSFLLTKVVAPGSSIMVKAHYESTVRPQQAQMNL